MGGAKKSTWVGGTVFAAVVILALAWFLAINPTLAAASEIRSQAEATKQSNEMLELQVTKLKADFAKLPEYKAELAGLQTQIPTEAMLSDYLRQLDGIAAAHSVTLTTVTPTAPTSVVLAAPVAPVVAAPVDGTTTDAPAAGTDGTVPVAPVAPAAPVAPTGLASIGFTITALGTYDNVLAFTSDLQNATPRLFLVTSLNGTSQKDTAASGGRPETKQGDLEMVIGGVVYVLPDSLGVPETVDPNAAAPVLPGAVPGKNPLVPITGR
jgi:Tfp pilus assembly protein PilO